MAATKPAPGGSIINSNSKPSGSGATVLAPVGVVKVGVVEVGVLEAIGVGLDVTGGNALGEGVDLDSHPMANSPVARAPLRRKSRASEA
jgi:hypothetical protein